MNLTGELNEEERIILATVEEYLKSRIAPMQAKWNSERQFPGQVMHDLAGLILPDAVPLPGGERLSEVTMGLISEAMGKHEFPIPAFLTIHFGKLLPMIADPDLMHALLRRFHSGDLIICGAFTEPGYGSDAASIITAARRVDSGYSISGEKSYVSSPGIANLHIVSARTGTSDSGQRHKGISLFAVESGASGLEAYEIENMASVFEGDFGGIRLSNVGVPAGNMIGNENGGFDILMKALGVQRVHVALYAIGIAESALADAIDHAKSRNVFGKPISKYEAISFRLAEDWAKIESVRLMAFRALAREDAGLPNANESAAVKGYGCETAFETVSHALQTLGASGYVKTSSMERKFRLSRGFLIGDGTPEVQKLIIARNLFGREFAP